MRAIVAALMLLSEQIDVPHHLMPRYQDEDDESRLLTLTVIRTNNTQAFYLQIRTRLTLSATPTDLLPNQRCSTLSQPAGR